MAALLRQGTRRIGVSVLQRTQAAVTSPAAAEERRRLLPRRMYTTTEQAVEEITRKIQHKKEELYGVMYKGEHYFWNFSFLQQLSVHVKPTPPDIKWLILRFTKRAVNVVDAAGFIALTYLVCSFVGGVRTFIRDRPVVRYMIMKEVAKAREAETRSGLVEN